MLLLAGSNALSSSQLICSFCLPVRCWGKNLFIYSAFPEQLHEQHCCTEDMKMWEAVGRSSRDSSALFCRPKNSPALHLDSTSANNPQEIEIIIITPILQARKTEVHLSFGKYCFNNSYNNCHVPKCTVFLYLSLKAWEGKSS